MSDLYTMYILDVYAYLYVFYEGQYLALRQAIINP